MMGSEQHFRVWQQCIAQTEKADWFGSNYHSWGKRKLVTPLKKWLRKQDRPDFFKVWCLDKP